MLMENIPHSPMIVDGIARDLSDNVAVAARALVKLHSSRLVGVRKHSIGDEIAALERGIERVVRLHPDTTQTYESILGEIVALADGIDNSDSVLTHGSYVPRHLLMGGGGLTMIDLDGLRVADPARDIGKFLAVLKKLALRNSWDEGEMESCAEVFLAEYGTRPFRNLKARIDFYYRPSLVRMACTAACGPSRRHFVPSMFAAAGEDFPYWREN